MNKYLGAYIWNRQPRKEGNVMCDVQGITRMTVADLQSLRLWLRCYPVVGREDERKRLQTVVECEIAARNMADVEL